MNSSVEKRSKIVITKAFANDGVIRSTAAKFTVTGFPSWSISKILYARERPASGEFRTGFKCSIVLLIFGQLKVIHLRDDYGIASGTRQLNPAVKPDIYQRALKWLMNLHHIFASVASGNARGTAYYTNDAISAFTKL
jgi:hypothetical protein